MENTFAMVAKTFEGLEPVLRDELISLGAENVEMGRRMVSFDGDLELMYKANLCLRTALRILKPIEKFTAHDPDELYDIVRDIPWENYMTPQTTFAIDATVNSSEFNHSRFATYRVKDGIVDHFRDLAGERPSIRVTDPDLLFNVHVDGDRVTISLDSSGEPLSKRGYREEQTEAPINEVLAAGIIMTTGWRGDSNFADPMCGSGTFLIEAALIAANINPGIFRKGFAFERWPDFDSELFETLYNDDSAERPFNYKIYGGDIDAEAVTIARKNIRNAQVDNMIELTRRPLSEWTDNPEPGVMVMNPPYGHRLKPEDMTELYRGIGQSLKRNFPGWNAWIIGLDDDDFANIGLKPSLKIPMINGSLQCSLREYVLFDGRYDNFRAEGGTIKGFEDEERREKGPKKMRRVSDEEWRSETKKFGGHGKSSRRDDRRDSRKDGKRDSRFRDERHGERREDNQEYRPRGEKHDFKPQRERREGNREYKPRDDRRGDRKDSRHQEGKGDFPRRDNRSREGRRNDRKEDFRRDGGQRYERGPRKITDRGPSISADREEKINPVHFRTRKPRKDED